MRFRLPTAVAAAIAAALTLAAAPAGAETFDLQAYIFCPTGTWCSHPSEQSLRNAWYVQAAEMNLEYEGTGISFRPKPPVIIQDDRYSGMRGPTEQLALNGEENDVLEAELINLYGATNTQEITMFLAPNLTKCWNGIPCPGDGNDHYNGDDVIFCYPPGGSIGRVYAHEMGHYWCLRHTFTGADSSDGSPVDHDGDDDVCPTLTNVPDTPPDPLGKEGSDTVNGVPVEWHEWCIATKFTGVDPGSPHTSGCTIDCVQVLGGVPTTSGESPFPHNGMSYYSGSSCRGPYVVNGLRYDAFTAGQAFQFAECRQLVPIRQLLVDVCATKGGDTDNDGWCDADDACPSTPNTPFDADNDQVPDDCDVCPFVWDPAQVDTDQDGFGDACDPDDDNDGCGDDTDQNPLDAAVVVGTEHYINCPDPASPLYLFEGTDSDDDGLLNCEDPDDDNDGTPDGLDACPAGDVLCNVFGQTCPLNPIWDICLLGGCNELLVRIQELINPDPTRIAVFEDVQIVGQHLSLGAIPGRTLSESAQAVVGQLMLPGGLPQGDLQMDVLAPTAGEAAAGDDDTFTYLGREYRVIATIMTYDPDVVSLGNVLNGLRLELTPPTVADPDVLLASAWSPLSVPGTVPRDGDADRVPDFADRCSEVPDRMQPDADRDGFGDACDPDVDQDGRVTDRDAQAVERCIGVDLLAEPVSMFDGDDRIPPPVPNDPAAEVELALCRGMDLNGDGVVGDSDLAIVQSAVGSPPGPSGATMPTDQLFSDGFESGDVAAWTTAVD